MAPTTLSTWIRRHRTPATSSGGRTRTTVDSYLLELTESGGSDADGGPTLQCSVARARGASSARTPRPSEKRARARDALTPAACSSCDLAVIYCELVALRRKGHGCSASPRSSRSTLRDHPHSPPAARRPSSPRSWPARSRAQRSRRTVRSGHATTARPRCARRPGARTAGHRTGRDRRPGMRTCGRRGLDLGRGLRDEHDRARQPEDAEAGAADSGRNPALRRRLRLRLRLVERQRQRLGLAHRPAHEPRRQADPDRRRAGAGSPCRPARSGSGRTAARTSTGSTPARNRAVAITAPGPTHRPGSPRPTPPSGSRSSAGARCRPHRPCDEQSRRDDPRRARRPSTERWRRTATVWIPLMGENAVARIDPVDEHGPRHEPRCGVSPFVVNEAFGDIWATELRRRRRLAAPGRRARPSTSRRPRRDDARAARS